MLQAGVVPRLTAQQADGGQAYRIVVFTPGPHPMEECAVRMAGLTGQSAAVVRSVLAENPENLHLCIRQALTMDVPAAELVLVVDQFEETFTLCTDPRERTWFINALVTAARSRTSRARIVLGVRADFYGRCGQYDELVNALRDSQVLVEPMTPDELREAITRPAEQAGLRVETALVSRLMAEATGQPGTLPT